MRINLLHLAAIGFLVALGSYGHADPALHPDSRKLLFEIIDKAKKLQCHEIKSGEDRIVSIDDDNSPSGVQHRYVLARTSATTYQATLNIEFFDASGKKSVNSTYLQKLESCLPMINQRLIGPKGEKLTIKLFKGEGGLRVPPVVAIGVRSKERADSMEYTLKPSCATIAHELFHLMGLVDEYEESENDYSCRSIGPKSSVMHDPLAAFQIAFPEVHSCECTNANCQALLAKGYSKKECPAGSEAKPKLWSSGMLAFGRFEDYKQSEVVVQQIMQVIERGSLSSGKVYYFVEHESKSLLLPGQFNTIVYPGCEKNNNYYLCAADAYGGTDEGSCLHKHRPATCQTGEWLLN